MLSSRQVGVVMAVLLTGGSLAGCGAHATQQGELAVLSPAGSPVLPATRGTGDQDLGAFTASGRLSVQATCVGDGLMYVKLEGINRGFHAGCSPARSQHVGGSQSAGDTFVVPAKSSFRILVQSKPGTDWTIAVSKSG